jgi:hypothetical protein
MLEAFAVTGFVRQDRREGLEKTRDEIELEDAFVTNTMLLAVIFRHTDGYGRRKLTCYTFRSTSKKANCINTVP